MPENQTRDAEHLTKSVADPATTTGGDASPVESAPLPPVSARYQLGEEIARGGMGVVYRAADSVLGREVAVKVLQYSQGPHSAISRRFADEAHIAAQLQHPAIPPIHDLGTLVDGRPFLAMKLIRGETLDALLKARPDPAADRGRFVAAFEQVCQAVAYAHDRKVIHRDLKPANVMVGNFAEVQVMDWGLAKVLTGREGERPGDDPEETAAGTVIHSHREDEAHTRAGSVLGTPAYMPPEQALGAVDKIDARSDVFGLGAVLAVILTGKPPFEASSAETSRIQAAQGKVDECFARLDASCADPELVALCKRCLSPSPADRPAHAGEVAKAVATLRAAADERARQAELDRAKAEVKSAEERKRWTVQAVLCLAVLIALLVGGVVAAWQWHRAVAEQGKTEQALASVTTERNNTSAALEKLKIQEGKTSAALIEKTVQEEAARGQAIHTYAALRAMTDQVIERLFGKQQKLGPDERAFLEHVIRQYEKVALSLASIPGLRDVKAEGLYRVAKIRNLLGDLRGAEAAYTAARDHLQELVKKFPGVAEYRFELFVTRTNLGLLYSETGRIKEAEVEHLAAVQAARHLIDELSTEPMHRASLGHSLYSLANFYQANSQWVEAETAYADARSGLRQLAAELPDEPEYQNWLAMTRNGLGTLYEHTNRPKEAEVEYIAARDLHAKLAEQFPPEAEYRASLSTDRANLGWLYTNIRPKAAEPEFLAARELRLKLVRDFPGVPKYLDGLASVRNRLGLLYRKIAREKDAEIEYAAARELWQKLADEFPDVPNYRNDLAGTMVNSASLLASQKDYARARRLLEEAEPHHRAALKANPRNPAYRLYFRNNRIRLADTLVELSDHAAVPPVVVEMLAYSASDPAGDAYFAATYLSHCAGLAQKDETLGDEKRKELTQQYGDLAVGYLKLMIARGLWDAATLRKNSAFDSIRGRPDFVYLLADLELKLSRKGELAPPPRKVKQ